MALPLLIDSSAFIAAARPREARHEQVAELLTARSADGLAAPVTILAETMSFVLARFGIEQQRSLWDAFGRSGIEMIPADAELLAVARDIDRRYSDANFGFADCTLLASCEVLRTPTILSLDQRLRVYRPTFASAIELLP